MLNTVMALWNQHPGANRQRIVKVCFTFLLIGVSIFLLLFTLNGSAWSSFSEKEQMQTRRVVQVGMRHHHVVVTAGETPVSAHVVTANTPLATRTLVQVCVHTPTAVVEPSLVPQKVEVYAISNNLERKASKPHHVRLKTVHIRKDRKRARKRSHVKVIATPVPQETAIVVPPPQPATPQPIVTPVVATTVAATPVPVEETPVSSMPDIVTINLTPDIATNSTDPFVQSLRQKGSIRISGSPEARSTKKAITKKSDRVYEYVECRGSTTHKYSGAGTVLKEKRRIGMLLGSPLLGIVLFYCFRFARKRKKFAKFLQRFKISSKNA